MKFLADVVVQLLKWVLPMALHELMAYFKKLKEERDEKKHDAAMEKLKQAESEEDIKEATRDIAKSP